MVGQRRVPGLRRGEVASLAGVSIEYYAKLERGALGGRQIVGVVAGRDTEAAGKVKDIAAHATDVRCLVGVAQVVAQLILRFAKQQKRLQLCCH